MKNKLVSILMPVKNEELFIKEAINSVLQQTYQDIELIIVNDGSDDKTEEIILSFKTKKIKFINTKGIGKNAAFNLAFSNSNGNYICFFAGDDILMERSIELRVKPLLDNKNTASLSRLITFSEEKKFNNVIIPKSTDKGNFSGGTIMFDRYLSERIFPIPEILANEDMWTALHIKNFSKNIHHISHILLKYRIHKNNSNRKDIPFKEKSISMHKRFIVYSVFLERYRNILKSDNIEYLSYMYAAETLRYSNNTLAILLLKKISISEKLRFFAYSSKLLYNIKTIFFNLLSS